MPMIRRFAATLLLSSLFPCLASGRDSEKKGDTSSRSGPSVTRQEVRQEIRLQAGSFDPLAGRSEGFLAMPLVRALDRRPREARYGIVQFHSRQAAAARKELAERGIRFFGPVPDGAFLIRLDPSAKEVLAGNEAVRWVGEWEPGFKVHSSLWPGSQEQVPEVTVAFFPGESAEKGGRLIENAVEGVRRTFTANNPSTPRVRFGVPGSIRDAFIEAAALEPSVAWIEPYHEPRLHNFDSSGPIQGNASGDAGRTIFKNGLTGTGQIVAVSDSGCDDDMCFFGNLNGVAAVTDSASTTPPALGPLFPNQKVIGYWVQPGASAYDNNATCPSSASTRFHGTHTSASAVGDNPANLSSPGGPGVDTGDGMAPNAQLLFLDIGNDSTGCLSGLGDFPATLKQAADGGARISTHSWGGSSDGSYGSDERLVDTYLFDDDRMAVFFSSGNEGAEGTIGSPAAAKNVVTVGALEHGDSTAVASYSSRGPAKDGRIKPDIMAPGSSIISASGDSTHTNGNCGTKNLSGTSMACPIAAGGSALLRQYFSDGFYPTGQRNGSDAWEIGGSTVKAVLLNGTLPIVSAGRTFGNSASGWGRVFLDNNLYFPLDSRKLRVYTKDNGQGLQTGSKAVFTVSVPEGQEFRATLVWSDPEGTLGAAKALVNDLDLIVNGDGSTYLGNVLNSEGVSIAGGSPDRLNNVEQVRIASPAAGTYTVTVFGTSVPGTGRTYTDRQGYALAISYGSCDAAFSEAPSGLAATSLPVMGAHLSFTPAAGSSVTQVYRADGPCEAPGLRTLAGETSRSSFDDTRAQGGFTYSYWVRGSDGCGEGPISSCVSVTPSGRCDLIPTFNGVKSVRVLAPSCRVQVTWDPATGVCPASDGSIRYNIYRHTSAGFTPNRDNLLASVSGVTEFVDMSGTFQGGVTYFYVVRAEELSGFGSGPSGGNEDPNVRSGFATALGQPSQQGEFMDDGGDNRATLIPEYPWYVTTGQGSSGSSCYLSAFPGSTYPAETCGALTTPPLLVGKSAILTYRARYNLEDEWDGVVVEVSSDDGATWTDLPPATGYPGQLRQTGVPPANACQYSSTHGAFTGPVDNTTLTSWDTYRSDLATYEGKTIKIRWRLTSDPGLEYDGFFLDDIRVTNVTYPWACTPSSPGPLSGDSGQTGVQKK